MEIRRDSGQASVEVLALIALVAIVLAGAASVAAVASPTVRNAITTSFTRALCTVTGQRCALLAREPCPVLRTTESSEQRLAVGFLRLGHDRELLIERRSDGSYRLSLVEGVSGGVGAAAGAGGLLTADAEASLLLGGRAGRTYVAATPEEARVLVERLRSQHLPALRSIAAGVVDLAGLAKADPSVGSYVLAGDAALDAAANLGLGGLVEGGLDLGASGELGVQVDAHEQALTVYARSDSRVGAFFEAFASLPDVPSGAAAAPKGARRSKGQLDPPDEAPELEADADLPVGVTARAGLVGGGSVALRYGPGPRLLGVELTGYLGSEMERREIHARLDPSDPDVRAAIDRWLAAPGSAEALRRLGHDVGASSALDERRFAMSRSGEHAFEAQVKALGGLGVDTSSGVTTGRLIEQRSRPVGGVWEKRLDCGAGATT